MANRLCFLRTQSSIVPVDILGRLTDARFVRFIGNYCAVLKPFKSANHNLISKIVSTEPGLTYSVIGII